MKQECKFSKDKCWYSHGDIIKKLHVMNQLSSQQMTSGCSNYVTQRTSSNIGLCEKNSVRVTVKTLFQTGTY